MTDLKKPLFSQSPGRWEGIAEVTSGDGRFLGAAYDRRVIQRVEEDGRIRVERMFIGPFRMSGHYFVESQEGHRVYQGPGSIGFADTLSEHWIDGSTFWPAVGLTQRFFLMGLPEGKRQIAYGLFSRGDQLLYSVVTEFHHHSDAELAAPPLVLPAGTSHDLASDPAIGQGALLLHRAGAWSGDLRVLNHDLLPVGMQPYTEQVRDSEEGLQIIIEGGGFAPETRSFKLRTDGRAAWTLSGTMVGSYNMSGGRALSAYFHHPAKQMRVWRREVISTDGLQKVVLHHWFQGNERIGVQFGLLNFALI